MALAAPWVGQPTSRGRLEDAWVFVGAASSFPNIDEAGTSLLKARLCAPGGRGAPTSSSCRVFHVPRAGDSLGAVEVAVPQAEAALAATPEARALHDQVLVFRYKDKFYAVDNQCPHSAYPLSHGVPVDIEDFGVVLGAALACSKHDWTFDLFSGKGDRGSYMLGVWDVQLRGSADAMNSMPGSWRDEGDSEDQEVWVRRRNQRI